MIDIKNFINILKKNDLNFCTGVPDSLFKDLCFQFEKRFKKNHITASNEGAAVAIGIGYHLKTKKIPLIYMQNSGLGNAINPIISLADRNVFNIPLFLIIGWRGEKNHKFIDEPQHITQGKETESFLKNLGIKYKIINSKSDYPKVIKLLKNYSLRNNKSVCLLIRKNSFQKKTNKTKKILTNLDKRESFLKKIVEELPKNSIIVSTTGILSRELYEILKAKKNKLNNLMCVGGMGHAISIATGIAKQTKKKVYCFDGDGAVTMHMGSLAISSKLKNLVHIVFNNFSHESVGGHDNAAKHVSFFKLANILGYENSIFIKNIKDISKVVKKMIKSKKSSFIEIICSKGHRANISRPKEKMIYLKNTFQKRIK
jgi:phosphonopyruvate decarboxylase